MAGALSPLSWELDSRGRPGNEDWGSPTQSPSRGFKSPQPGRSPPLTFLSAGTPICALPSGCAPVGPWGCSGEAPPGGLLGECRCRGSSASPSPSPPGRAAVGRSVSRQARGRLVTAQCLGSLPTQRVGVGEGGLYASSEVSISDPRPVKPSKRSGCWQPPPPTSRRGRGGSPGRSGEAGGFWGPPRTDGLGRADRGVR